MKREIIVKHVSRGRKKIILTFALLLVAGLELYILGSPEWQSILLFLLAIPVLFVLVYYRK